MERGANVTPAPNVDHFSFYIDAFRELNSCRDYGMGLGPIPFTAIAEYAKIYEVEDFDEFLYLIRVMDNQFIKSQNARASKERNIKNKTSRR